MPGVRTPGSGVARSPRCGHREAAAGSRAWPSLLLTCEIAGAAPRPESPKDPGPAQRPPQSVMRWRRCALDRGSARAPGRGPEGRAEARAEHRRALAETSRARLRSQQGHGDQRVPPHTYVRAPSCPGAEARAPHPVPAPASAHPPPRSGRWETLQNRSAPPHEALRTPLPARDGQTGQRPWAAAQPSHYSSGPSQGQAPPACSSRFDLLPDLVINLLGALTFCPHIRNHAPPPPSLAAYRGTRRQIKCTLPFVSVERLLCCTHPSSGRGVPTEGGGCALSQGHPLQTPLCWRRAA